MSKKQYRRRRQPRQGAAAPAQPQRELTCSDRTLRRLDSLAKLLSVEVPLTPCVAIAFYGGECIVSSNEAKQSALAPSAKEVDRMRALHRYLELKMRVIRKVLHHFLDGVTVGSQPDIQDIVLNSSQESFLKEAICVLMSPKRGGFAANMHEHPVPADQVRPMTAKLLMGELIKVTAYCLLGVYTGGRRGFTQEELRALLASDVTFVYRNERSRRLLDPKTRLLMSLHAEQAILSYVKDKPSWGTQGLSIGISKLCCQVCQQAVEAEQAVLVRGNSNQYWPGVYDVTRRRLGDPLRLTDHRGSTVAPTSRSPGGLLSAGRGTHYVVHYAVNRAVPRQATAREEAAKEAARDIAFMRALLGRRRGDVSQVCQHIQRFWKQKISTFKQSGETIDQLIAQTTEAVQAGHRGHAQLKALRRIVRLMEGQLQHIADLRVAMDQWELYSGRSFSKASQQYIATQYLNYQQMMPVLTAKLAELQADKGQAISSAAAAAGGGAAAAAAGGGAAAAAAGGGAAAAVSVVDAEVCAADESATVEVSYLAVDGSVVSDFVCPGEGSSIYEWLEYMNAQRSMVDCKLILEPAAVTVYTPSSEEQYRELLQERETFTQSRQASAQCAQEWQARLNSFAAEHATSLTWSAFFAGKIPLSEYVSLQAAPKSVELIWEQPHAAVYITVTVSVVAVRAVVAAPDRTVRQSVERTALKTLSPNVTSRARPRAKDASSVKRTLFSEVAARAGRHANGGMANGATAIRV